jgi:hypothetical protein
MRESCDPDYGSLNSPGRSVIFVWRVLWPDNSTARRWLRHMALFVSPALVQIIRPSHPVAFDETVSNMGDATVAMRKTGGREWSGE